MTAPLTHALNAHDFAALAPDALEEFLDGLDIQALEVLRHDWRFWARREQIAPDGEWTTWAYIAGRGAGKSRAGAEWILEKWRAGARIIHLISGTEADYRDVMINGPSGILACAAPWEMPRFIPSQRKLVFPDGAYALCFSSGEPERLRGPQCEFIWADELAAWQNLQDTWDMAMFGLRLGKHPQVFATTTPKPLPLIKSFFSDANAVVTRGSTFDNAANLAKPFLDKILQKFEGTRLGRQEIYAEILEDNPDALFTYEILEMFRVTRGLVPPLRRRVIAVDPPVTSGEKADECGIVYAGLGEDGHAYVLGDYSERGLKPLAWASKVAGLARGQRVDCVVGEVNQGGELVGTLLREVDPNIPFREVRARQGKWLRAEPVALLYEQGRVHHVGQFPKLEDQMVALTPEGTASGKSPDRVDALVYAITNLMLDSAAGQNAVHRMNY